MRGEGRGRRGNPGGEEIFSSAKTPAGARTPAPALAPGHAMSCSTSTLIWVDWRGATGRSQCNGCGEGYRDGHP